MDGRRFDQITKALATDTARRGFLGWAGKASAAALALVGAAAFEARPAAATENETKEAEKCAEKLAECPEKETFEKCAECVQEVAAECPEFADITPVGICPGAEA